MKILKSSLILFGLALFCFALSIPTALAANIVVDKQTGPAASGLFHTSNYANDAACIKAALDKSNSGDTITFKNGVYKITTMIRTTNKNLNIVGEGNVTFDLHTGPYTGFLFEGSLVSSQTISSNAKKGSSKIILKDASKVRKNYLIRIWKNVKWCPLDYPNQMTGELYQVQNINGNVVTLNQPLLRDYNLKESVKVEIYKPVEINIKNIRVQNVDATGANVGITLRYCKDSSVSDCIFKDNGETSLRIGTCFNMDVKNNKIYNSIHKGNGYGVSVIDSTAFVNIENNYIKNCRHTIMGGTGDFKALNRDIIICNNILIGANIESSHVIDSHPMTINYVITRNKIYPYPGSKWVAFNDGTLNSEFSDNEVYGGHGAVAPRGIINGGVHVIKNNIVKADYLYGGTGNSIGDTLTIMNNTQIGNWYGVGLNTESFKNIIIKGNSFSNLAQRGIDITFHTGGVNLEICNNIINNTKSNAVYVDGNKLKTGSIKVQNNNLINVNPSNPKAGILVKNVQNPIISGNQIRKVLVTAFSAPPTSGKASLNGQFVDGTVNDMSSWMMKFWRWNIFHIQDSFT